MKQIFLASLVGAMCASPVLAAPIDPFALYTFDNGLLVDDSGNGNTGTSVGGAASLAVGASADGSNAARFGAVAGLSGIDTGIDINRSAISAITMGALVNLASLGSTPGSKILSHDNGGFDRTLGVDTRGNDTGTGFAAFTGAGVADAPGTAPLDVWAHLTVVYDGTDSKLFVDGVVEATFNEATALTDSGFNLFIGTNPGFNEDFIGLLDDVFIYDRALSNAEVLDIATNGFGPIAAVPLPAGLPLLIGGFGAFAMIRKKKS